MPKRKSVKQTTLSSKPQTQSCGSSQPSPTQADTLPQRLRRAKGLDLDLKAEAADEIDRLTALREEDGRAMSALIDGYQRMMRACIDGTVDKWHRDVMSAMSDEITRLRQVFSQQNLTLTDEERKALEIGIGILSDAGWGTVRLRALLKRLSPPTT
jgi:hypothetical protein